MNVPFLDFSEQYKTIKDNIDVRLKDVFEKSNFILGQPVKDFEEEFAGFCSVKHGTGVNSGTDALFLGLSALGVGPGDEVILPSFTFIATALGVSYTGATPVLVDIEEDTYNMDPAKLKGAVTDKTKVVLPVHLYGQAADMVAINAAAKEHGLKVVEDSAQAHGARYNDSRIGSLGDVACFSFYPTKGLGGFGDGGMVITNDKTVDEKVKMLRDYGRENRYDHIIKGYNSRLDTVQAVVLSEKLKYLDEWNKNRAEKAAYYCELLKDVDEVKTPVVKEGRTHVYQTFAVRVKDRDRICDEMKQKGVGVLIHYPIPVHLQKAYSDLNYKAGDFPVSEAVAGEILSLPMFPHITDEQIEYVCESLKACY